MSASATVTMSASASSGGDSDSEGGGTSGGDDSSGSTGATSQGTSQTGGTTNPNPDGLPNGSECTADGHCMSGNCYDITLPLDDLPDGVCGICDEDADCVAQGLGISCSLDIGGYQTKCTDGGIGSFCESQAACKDGLYCDELVEGIGGLLPMSCGTCLTDAECNGSARCTPKIDVGTYSGNKYCAEPGSVQNDGLCPLAGGDAVCASGICAIVDLGVLVVGVCGQCEDDADCPMGQKCKAGKFDGGFIGPTCG